MNDQWYTKKWVVISLHTLFWALFFVSPFLLRPISDNGGARLPHRNETGFIYLLIFKNLFFLFLFYGNAYVFIPRLIYKKKYSEYFFSLVGMLVLLFFWDRFFFNLFIEGREHRLWNFIVFNIFPFLFIAIASTAYRMIQDKVQEDKKIKERETEHLKTELSFLRSQVSPHFMFNVLNNMVALARKKSDALEPSLIKLSSLLRYMLYETDEDKVLVEKEVDYLQSYIDLQQQRFGKNVQINTCFKKIENGHTIEPMLLIPFVENAFKHGTGLITDAQIDVHLKVENGELYFSVQNRYSDVATETKDKTSGIGLNNVKRRLNLLYQGRHSLTIKKENGWFTVLLHLNLH